MSYHYLPVWNFNNNGGGYFGYFNPSQPPPPYFATDRNNPVYPVMTNNASPPQQYSSQQRGWTPFYGYGGSAMDYNYLSQNAMQQPHHNDETMSDGIRALLDLTRNFKKQSKFDGALLARSQDSIAENFAATDLHVPSSQLLLDNRVTAPPTSSAAVSKTVASNYANAVKRTLMEPKRGEPVVVYSSSNRTPTVTHQQQQQMTSTESRKWVDRSGRPTVNAKAMDGGPKINGRSIVNGINLNNLKFVKPARQCPKWDQLKHRLEEPNCPLWHPRERCQYYPRCRLTAEVCGFGHPFCGDYCQCEPDKRSLQMNHLIRRDAVEKKQNVQQSRHH